MVRRSMRAGGAALGFAIALILALVAPESGQAQTYNVLLRFNGYPSDGRFPPAGVVLDSVGNLYGTTQLGGAYGDGIVFKLDTTGKETVLHSFFAGKDGTHPGATPILDTTGNLYGTTQDGGASNSGTIFKLDPSGKKIVLYSFTGGKDGGNPAAALVRDAAGNLYGTTVWGGGSNYGTVFKLDTRRKQTILYSFTGGKDGANPVAGVVLDAAGNLYGTTFDGGASLSGVVFRLSKTGKEKVLHTFTGGNDGANPYAGVVLDAANNLYGTTYFGALGYGTVFKLDKIGKETILYSFKGGADGANPTGGVALGAAGNLYGTTFDGGASGFGTIFKLDTTGQESVWYSFTGSADGAWPYAGLILDSAGNLYGTTLEGGSRCGGSGCGVVFKVSPQ
jgi:uncharacterized repeat protein (TIGR03803 family)